MWYEGQWRITIQSPIKKQYIEKNLLFWGMSHDKENKAMKDCNTLISYQMSLVH